MAGAPDAAPGPVVGRRAWVAALAVGGVAIAASRAASWAIVTYFPDRPMPRDLILDTLPYAAWAQYLADVTVLLGVALLLGYLIMRSPRLVPRAVAMFGTMYLLRAGIIVMTPLASPHGALEYGLMPAQFGMFPSGHSANVLLCVLLVDAARAPGLRRTMVALAVLEVGAMLLSRGHYSIDIIGGALLTYFVYNEWTRGRLFAPLKRLVEPAGPAA